ncbi:MAG TPA: ABC transporter ATP-binding protein [Thermomicrobiales bacterium]|nr:ABC transporter ATP-binding protein [Thermomicrobiales bacterium]
MAIVETRNLSKHFADGVVAVDSINLRTADGEFLVLLGPSGCGKTTLLRMLGGLEQPTAGEILIGDRVVNHLPPRARQIAMVFQSYALYPHMSVKNNIAFPLKAAKIDKTEQKRKIEWAAGILGIDHLMDRKPGQLSGGQRQRVALARALVREPNVFLLDEPLSNLDAQRRASARDELQVFQREIGTTTVYVTHDQVEAMGMGHRIAVIDSGRVRQLGTPRDIYEHPADTFVATFLGSPPMNLVPQGTSLLGFRPENVHPAPNDGSADAASHLVFTLDRIREEYLGSEKLIYGEIDGTRAVSRVAANHPVTHETGSSATFVVHRRDIRAFDAETGLAVNQAPPRVTTTTGQVAS